MEQITKSLPDGIVQSRIGSLDVLVRLSDGWVDATHMAQSADKMIGHWTRLDSTKKKIEFFRGKVCGEVIQLQHGTRTWMLPKLAIQFGQWISDDYAWAVSEVIEKYQKGDLSLAAEVVQNFDAANGTRSTVLIDSVLESQSMSGLPIEMERRISIERTKMASKSVASLAADAPMWCRIKNNKINQATFGFQGSTVDFRKTIGIKKYESPRKFASSQHLNSINYLENALKFMAEGSKDAPEFLDRITQFTETVFKANELAGIHKAKLLKNATMPVPADHVPRNLITLEI